jgi:hypothetical protein
LNEIVPLERWAAVHEDDFITRAVRQLAAAIARTSAAEVRAEADVERERAEAALGRARDALGGGDPARALRELELAIGRLTHLSPSTALRIDAASLRALAPIGGASRLAELFRVRADVLRALDRHAEAAESDRVARGIG